MASMPSFFGLPKGIEQKARTVAFNDLAALERALAGGDTACLIAEPMLTNCNIVFPDRGFWPAAERLAKAAGVLLVVDEAHTHSFAFGGLTRLWGLHPDVLILRKGFGTGVPFAAYGVTVEIARLMERNLYSDPGGQGLALGGTTYASALAFTAARAALESCMREADYARVDAPGAAAGPGLEAIFRRQGLAWRAPVIGGRTGWVLAPELPRDAEQSRRAMDRDFADGRKLFMVNRGLWDAVASAGPGCSFQHGEAG